MISIGQVVAFLYISARPGAVGAQAAASGSVLGPRQRRPGRRRGGEPQVAFEFLDVPSLDPVRGNARQCQRPPIHPLSSAELTDLATTRSKLGRRAVARLASSADGKVGDESAVVGIDLHCRLRGRQTPSRRGT